MVLTPLVMLQGEWSPPPALAGEERGAVDAEPIPPPRALPASETALPYDVVIYTSSYSVQETMQSRVLHGKSENVRVSALATPS